LLRGRCRTAQALKELCDKRKWSQPYYKFFKTPFGDAHQCSLCIKNVENQMPKLISEPAGNQKNAKSQVAACALQKLSELGYGLDLPEAQKPSSFA
jgi:dsRNA-specific ribonuclease